MASLSVVSAAEGLKSAPLTWRDACGVVSSFEVGDAGSGAVPNVVGDVGGSLFLRGIDTIVEFDAVVAC